MPISERIINFIVTGIVYYLAKYRYYSILALLVKQFVVQINPDGSRTRSFSSKTERIVLLALDADSYRGELEVLAKDRQFRILAIRNKWQLVLLNGIQGNSEKINFYDYATSSSESVLGQTKWRTESILREVLCNLCLLYTSPSPRDRG